MWENISQQSFAHQVAIHSTVVRYFPPFPHLGRLTFTDDVFNRIQVTSFTY
jgi:hypothetical protein